MNRKQLRKALGSGETTVGGWLQFAQPAHAEIFARAGFDWAVVDLEHSVLSLREAEDLVRILDLGDCVPLVRMSSNDPVQIARIMDAGAHGIVVPQVNTRAQAEAAVAAVHYPPVGKRGVGLARAHGYGGEFEGYCQWLSENGVVIIQVENGESVENLHEILSVEGVQGFLIGPYDLSASLGVPGQLDHPRMLEALAKVHQIAEGFPQIAKGIHKVGNDPQPVLDAANEGYRLIAYSTDMLFLSQSCAAGMAAVRAGLSNAGKNN